MCSSDLSRRAHGEIKKPSAAGHLASGSDARLARIETTLANLFLSAFGASLEISCMASLKGNFRAVKAAFMAYSVNSRLLFRIGGFPTECLKKNDFLLKPRSGFLLASELLIRRGSSTAVWN